jgi:hypothetical protein
MPTGSSTTRQKDLIGETRRAMKRAEKQIEKEVQRVADLIFPALSERRDLFLKKKRQIEEDMARGARRTKHRIPL